MKKKVNSILILGARGYLGSMLTNELKSKFNVFCQLRKLPENTSIYDGAHIINKEVKDLATDAAIKRNNFEVVINLISCDHYESETNLYNSTDAKLGTLTELFDLLVKEKIIFKKYINMSSIHVYGNTQNILNEDSSTSPKNNYSINHLLSEIQLKYFTNKFKISSYSLRLSNSFGYPINESINSWSLVINDLCKQAVYNNSMIINSNGLIIRDFIYYKNLANAIILIVDEEPQIKAQIINVSSGKSVTIIEVALIIVDIMKMLYNKEIEIYINKKTKFLKLTNTEKEIIQDLKNKYCIKNNLLLEKDYSEKFNLREGIIELIKDIEIGRL